MWIGVGIERGIRGWMFGHVRTLTHMRICTFTHALALSFTLTLTLALIHSFSLSHFSFPSLSPSPLSLSFLSLPFATRVKNSSPLMHHRSCLDARQQNLHCVARVMMIVMMMLVVGVGGGVNTNLHAPSSKPPRPPPSLFSPPPLASPHRLSLTISRVYFSSVSLASFSFLLSLLL